ncbi:MAG: hypothetical protein FD160_3772 [Caulobacteraceae bacterium]|nr:MAG: hypothetical protein FD160_3772 [Caulobacteraceae bacterium]
MTTRMTTPPACCSSCGGDLAALYCMVCRPIGVEAWALRAGLERLRDELRAWQPASSWAQAAQDILDGVRVSAPVTGGSPRHDPIVSLEYRMRLVSEPNMRGRWHAKSGRVKLQRDTAWAEVLRALSGCGMTRMPAAMRLAVRMTRIGGTRSKRMDDDNLAGALKATQDGIALALHIDDGDSRLRWLRAQEKRAGVEHSVRIEIWEVQK